MTPEELIKQLKMLKAEIEWEHSLEYQLVLDEVIRMVKQFDTIRDYLADINPVEIKSHLGTGTEVSWIMNWKSALMKALEGDRL